MWGLLFFFAVLTNVRLGYAAQKYNSCEFKSSFSKKNLLFYSQFQRVSSENFVIYFNLCDTIPAEYCGHSLKICIKTKNILLMSGYEWRADSQNATISSHEKEESLYVSDLKAPSCGKIIPRVRVTFECKDDSKAEPRLIINGECDFEIRLLHPTCIPKCTTRVFNRLIDLRPLTNVYKIVDDFGNFSIGLCTSNPQCGSSGSTCVMKDNAIIPISENLQKVHYDNDKRLITIHGKFKGDSGAMNKIMEVQVKCVWDQTEPVFYFIKMPNQGKKYHFEMLTSYGCFKWYTSSEVKNGPYLFNFEALYKKNGYWKIQTKEDGELLLNIFGPLKLPTEDNMCSKASSQICLKNGSEVINFGTMQTPLQINNDVISMQFTSGSICSKTVQKHPIQQRQTSIEFFCDKFEKGPQLVSMSDCETQLKWETPSACPKYDRSTCSHTMNSSYHNCILEYNDYFFNLTSLFKHNGKYVIKDENDTIEYLLNICGPVFDEDAPCNNNSVFLKDSSESDIRKRFISLGKMKDIHYQNNNLILEMRSGGLCDPHDYQSVIYLECSDQEEPPKLKTKEKCKFVFSWKTAKACPIIFQNIESKCAFKDVLSSAKINLDKLQRKNHYLKVNISGKNYIFDLCNGYDGKCSLNDGCIHLKAKQYLLKYGNKTFVEFLLNRTCNSPHEFNRTLMELECDIIENNDHYDIPSISDCTMRYKLWTHLACEQDLPSYYLYDSSEEKHIKKKDVEICTVSNPITKYTFNITNLKLNFSSNECPTYIFNNTKKVVELIFKTDRSCQNLENEHISDENNKFRYKVLLRCSDHNSHVVQNIHCEETHTYDQTEYCKLLEGHVVGVSLNWLEKTGIALFVIVVVVFMVWGSIKYRRDRRLYRGLTLCDPYRKNADL